MVKTQDPAGQWEKPVCVIRGKGYIDTTPLWDDDGRCYMMNGWAMRSKSPYGPYEHKIVLAQGKTNINGLDYQALLVKRVGKAFQLVVTTCKQADKGKAPEETLIATLKPTAEDKIDYKPGIHEDIFLRLKVTLPDADKLKNNSQGFDGKPQVRFSYSMDGKKYTDCGESYKMRQGKWIGAKFGFVSVETDSKADRGNLDIDWIRVTK